MEKDETDLRSKSLGLIPLPEKTFEHDLALGDRYQNFSAELLRLSLAGIGAVGFLVLNVALKIESVRAELLLQKTIFGPGLFFSLLFFGIAAAFALAHRYIGTESQAYHLVYMRRLIRKSEKDEKDADLHKTERDKIFKWSARVLLYSAISLWLGAITLILAFYPVLFKFRDF